MNIFVISQELLHPLVVAATIIVVSLGAIFIPMINDYFDKRKKEKKDK